MRKRSRVANQTNREEEESGETTPTIRTQIEVELEVGEGSSLFVRNSFVGPENEDPRFRARRETKDFSD